MKKVKLFLALGLSSAFVFGIGKVLNIHNEVKPVAADTPMYSGSFIIQKNDDGMKSSDSKLVAYFFDDNIHRSEWGTAVANDGKSYQKYEWNFDFNPVNFIVLRVSSANWSVNDPWNNVWSRTANLTVAGADVVWMTHDAGEFNNNNNDKWGTYSMETFVVDDSDQELFEL